MLLAGTTYFGKTRFNPNAPEGSGNGFADNGFEEVDYTVSGLTDASANSAFPLANYVVFDNLSADSLLITLDGMKNAKAGIGGFQIVGDVIPEPATIGLLGVFGGAMAFVRKRFSA